MRFLMPQGFVFTTNDRALKDPLAIRFRITRLFRPRRTSVGIAHKRPGQKRRYKTKLPVPFKAEGMPEMGVLENAKRKEQHEPAPPQNAMRPYVGVPAAGSNRLPFSLLVA